VRERLVILELPEDLHAQVGDGTIPPGAIRSLVELAKIHCGLPGRAVAEIAAADSGEYTGEPYSWADLARDPLQVATANAEQLPDDVYTTGIGYPLDRFSLTEKAGRDLARWANLDGRDPGELLVRFGAEDLAAAEKLGALHRAGNGWSAAIVGQDVADQLVADQVKELLKRAREFAKWSREDSPAEAGEAPEDGSVDEEAAKAERQREREAQQQARREAAAHNAVLGSACVKHLARVKVDDRVVRVLSAFDLGSELDKIALRGARYGLPGWPLEEQRKNGTTKTVYLDRADAEKKAREFLVGARSAAEIADRQVVLLAMARYADEHAVAQSQRSFHTLTPGGQLPFSGEVIDQLDELCAEKVPAHVLDRGRDDRERQAAERAKDREDRAWLAEQYEGLEAMSPEQRQAVLADHEQRFGPYAGARWQLEQRIRELDEVEPPAEEPTASNDEEGEPAA